MNKGDKKFFLIVGMLIGTMVYAVFCVSFYGIGIGFSRPKSRPVSQKSDIVHYNDYVQVVRGFYTGTRGKVLKRGWSDKKGEVSIYTEGTREVIDVRYSDLEKLEGGEKE